MNKQTDNSRRFVKRLAAVGVGATLIASGAIGAHSLAAGGEEGGPPPPPGAQPVGEESEPPADDADLVLGSGELIQSGGSDFDPTIVSKFIAAQGFQVFQGEGIGADTVAPESGNATACVKPGPTAAGTLTQMAASLELPDGARIKQLSLYGQDDDAADDISVRLFRQEFSTPLVLLPLTPTSSRTRTEVDAFSTSGQQGDASIFFGTNDLEEITGNFRVSGGVFIGPTLNRFHTVSVSLTNGADHVFCGVRVDYQVPAVADPGTTFHPIEPYRAFDSRLASFGPLSGRLMPNSTKVIDITDGYDSAGVAIPAQENLVPSNATAITYTITAAGQTGPNFVAVTAGDAAGFTASAINYTGSGSIANGSTVTVAADETIKVWGGDNTGSAHVIIDVTGYYAPAPYPNMAN
jgi:hypothetical protein